MSNPTTVSEVLQYLCAPSVADVTLVPLAPVSGADLGKLQPDDDRRDTARDRGDCNAAFGGESVPVSGALAEALIAAGAADKRDEAPGAP